jgi:hypothetical protein
MGLFLGGVIVGLALGFVLVVLFVAWVFRTWDE